MGPSVLSIVDPVPFIVPTGIVSFTSLPALKTVSCIPARQKSLEAIRVYITGYFLYLPIII